MRTIQINTTNPILKKVQEALNSVTTINGTANIPDLTHQELRYIKRLLLSDEATTTLMFASLNEGRDHAKECDSNANNS